MRSLLVLLVFTSADVARPQSPQTPTTRFEVVSVKQNLSGESGDSDLNHRLPDRFTVSNTPLYFLIQDAYDLHGDYELANAPDWTWDKSYDIVATFPAGSHPDILEVRRMEQQLLADRFGLKLHPEKREIPAYNLVLARKNGQLGPQLHQSTMDCATWAANGRPKINAKNDAVLKSPVSPTGERPICSQIATRTWLSAGARTMQDLAGILQVVAGRPVIDKTGLAGAYDIDLKWARNDLRAGDTPASSTDAPSLFTAVEEQLGLKLVPHKETFDMLVIDHIQPATPN